MNTLHFVLVYFLCFPGFDYSNSRIGSEFLASALGATASWETARNCHSPCLELTKKWYQMKEARPYSVWQCFLYLVNCATLSFVLWRYFCNSASLRIPPWRRMGRWRYRSVHLRWQWMAVGGEFHVSNSLPLGKLPDYPSDGSGMGPRIVPDYWVCISKASRM